MLLLTAANRAAFATRVFAGVPQLVTPTLEELVSTRSVNVGRLAAAVAARIRTRGRCAVKAVGPLPCHNALKSVVIASSFLHDEHAGKGLAVTPEQDFERRRTAPSGRITDTSLMRLQVRLLPRPPVGEGKMPEVFIASGTNVGQAAGMIARITESRGLVTVGGMGPAATSNALKALIIAQSYMAELSNGKALVAFVSSEKFKEKSEERTRLVMSCTWAPFGTDV
mmetsp:Transcript_69557/g.192408  ORF Transcript_69557/g.192408 Transcript_69557/m.192408 type:complete len:225 (-) Transcript_69557:7-681(-)